MVKRNAEVVDVVNTPCEVEVAGLQVRTTAEAPLLTAGVTSPVNSQDTTQEKPSPGVSKCNHPRCLTCPFLKEGQAHYTFTSTKEKQRIHDPLNCKSKNLIYLIECKKCRKQYIGETKRHLHQRFGEHRRSILNFGTTSVSEHFKQADHSINDVRLIPLEVISSNLDSVRKVREARLIERAMTLEPHGINRRDELNKLHLSF